MFKSLTTYFFIFLIVLSIPAMAQESSVVSAMIEEASGDISLLDEMILDHETLLNKYPKSEFAPTLMFQLAELHYERSQLVFQQEMGTFEQKMAAFQQGETSVEPEMPALNMERSISYCSTLIEKYPNVKYRDKVIYKLAISYMDAGDLENAKINFELLTQEYPNSPIALESHFRIGEYYFEKRQFDEAVRHYKLLLNHWDNPYYNMSLYKLGWTYYNQGNYSEAISTFLALIEDINAVEKMTTPRDGLSAMDLRTESIHYIASSFTEHGGPQLASEFFQSMTEKEYTPAVLEKMAELYEKRNMYAEAIHTYRVLLDFYPFHQNAPTYFDMIVQDYEAVHDISAANVVREEKITYFGPGSDWLRHYAKGDMHEVGLNVARETLVYLGTFFQAQAQQLDSTALYGSAIKKYKEYIDKFPNEENTSEIHYFLAECFYQSYRYSQAADAYHEVVTKYPDSSYREKAAFNRIFSYVQMKQPQASAQPDTVHIANFIAGGDSATVFISDPADKLVLFACNDFCLGFQKSAWLDQVYMKYGEILNENDAYLHAVDVYKKVFELKSSVYKLAAGMSIGQCYFDGGYFEKSLEWFTSIPKAFPDSTEQVNRALRLASSSQFKIAEKLSTGGDTSEAASVLLSIAESSREAAFQERALFEAAAQLQKSGDQRRAAETFERLAQNHPAAELSDRALYQAGTIRESLSEWQNAAGNYIKIFDGYPESEWREQALKNAALCYENAGSWMAASQLYQRYIEAYPDNHVDVLEFTFKAGETAYKANQLEDATFYFEQTVRTFTSLLLEGEALDNYFVAQAQFMIGEILYADYVNLDLKPPFEANLKKKVVAFTEVVKAYTESIKYQIADWSTASSHRIGMSFEEFVRAFLEAPIPDDLSDEQKQLYREKLAEKARPYKERALDTYEKNIEQAKANGINNSWVEHSRKRALALRQELQFGGQADASQLEGAG